MLFLCLQNHKYKIIEKLCHFSVAPFVLALFLSHGHISSPAFVIVIKVAAKVIVVVIVSVLFLWFIFSNANDKNDGNYMLNVVAFLFTSLSVIFIW